MSTTRADLIGALEERLDTELLVYVTGDRRNFETQIHSEVIPRFSRHLDAIGDVERITMFVHTRGGDTLAAWSLANLIRQFCAELKVIVPMRAHSAGTLICLAADEILMTKQATLGPIDPSVTTPLNPSPQGNPNARIPVSVEDINAFLQYARETVGDDSSSMRDVFLHLADRIHPHVLGSAFRARAQIRMLASKLLERTNGDITAEARTKILDFLCSESGSHDYTINRNEARDDLGLPVQKPDQQLYESIAALFDDISSELELEVPFEPTVLLGQNKVANYAGTRALIQSTKGGSDRFVSEGTLQKHELMTPQGVSQPVIQDMRTFEAWRHEDSV